ncbi:aldo/keto reductase [Devosia sp.]|uniref:aldo/keto reductase n=1 Tax=Devosia sp. TaxID=1871048 RepID=UPI0025F70D8E|nr:aldo/keto reductase [Devosia sp.]MCR6636460.1 aldo/keto reductase [Devosia sp.]
MKLHDVMPLLGFGTYGRWNEEGVEAILAALEIGYRHLDTAQTYDTESQVGTALQRSGLARSDVFLTTKISTENYGAGKLIPSLETSLGKLDVEQVDLTLLHWPSPNGAQPLGEYLEPLLEAQDRGLTRFIGVSNFTIALLEEARSIAGEGRISNNQIELNPFIQNKKLAQYCVEHDILVTCYQPIAHGHLGEDAVLVEMAKRYSVSPEQLALAFELAKGYAAIPTSGKVERIRSNFAAQQLILAPEDIALIETRDRNLRAIAPDWGPDWD